MRSGRKSSPLGVFVIPVVAGLLLADMKPAAAHPHVLIDAKATFQLDANRRIEAIRIEWRFDEFFSAYALEELQVESSDDVTEEQRAAMAEQYMSNLVEWDYMTELAVDADYATLGPANDYSVSVDDDIVSLTFTLPVSEPVDATTHDVGLRMYDPTYYISIEYVGDDALRIDGARTDGCTATVDDSEPMMETVPLSQGGFAASDRSTSIGFLYAQTGRIRCE